MTFSVIVVTLNRPQELHRCLECLAAQKPRPEQVIVVDASSDDTSRRIVENFEGVLYLRNDSGFGHMTRSRNIGLHRATGEVIAFLDDDAFAHDGWSENLLATYRDDVAKSESDCLTSADKVAVLKSTIGAVGGRALNNQPNESQEGVNSIGKLQPDGRLSGFFAADPGQVIEVDHIVGCNMSFRRDVLAKLGGFREDYAGHSSMCEESDMCLRVRQIGYHILFNPRAVVDHLGAPQMQGKRFDWRYNYYSQRNHIMMLLRNFGLKSPLFRRYLLLSAKHVSFDSLKRMAGAAVRLGTFVGGTGAGILMARRLTARTGRSPLRNDEEGHQLREWLSENHHDLTNRKNAETQSQKS